MNDKANKYLFDIRTACGEILELSADLAFEDFAANRTLRVPLSDN
jgi:hypothetical protein